VAHVTTVLADSSVNLSNPILPEWPELIIGIIAFAIVFSILAVKLLPRIRTTLQERTEAIEGGLQQAEAAQAEAEQVKADARAQLAELRHSTADIRAKAQAEGTKLVEQARADATTQKEAIIASAHTQLEADRNSAVNLLKADLGKLATELADKIVGERAQDAALQERVIDRFLDELDAKLNASEKVG
jgi:F-type H+-transporting ATPase subunit b